MASDGTRPGSEALSVSDDLPGRQPVRKASR